jgi:hypothetical protein
MPMPPVPESPPDSSSVPPDTASVPESASGAAMVP